jgi:beta-lactamase class A
MRRRTLFTLPLLAGGSRAFSSPALTLPEEALAAIAGAEGQVCLYARNLETGREAGVRADERVRTASTIKLAILAALFAKVEAGEAAWDELLTLRESDKVSGSGVLCEMSPGVRLPLRDVARLMIVVSDNTATNLVLDRITADWVNSFLDRLGLEETRALRKVRGDGTQLKEPSGWSKAGLVEENRRFGIGVSTPREMVLLLEKLARGAVVSQAASSEMVAILKRQHYKDGIGRRLGRFEVASKSGALDALRSDAGLVFTPRGRVAMAVTVDGLKEVDYSEDNPGLLLIARLSEILVSDLMK